MEASVNSIATIVAKGAEEVMKFALNCYMSGYVAGERDARHNLIDRLAEI